MFLNKLTDQLKRSDTYRRWDGERKLRQRYRNVHKKDLDLGKLNTFTEKLFARLISINRNGNAVYTKLADKYLVQDYVREKIGEDYLIKLIWQGTNPHEIPFDSLPQKCIIKPNHSSGKNLIIKGKVDRKKVIDSCQAWLRQDFYRFAQEYHYSSIFPRRILIQEFLEDGELEGALDYRIWCFDGVPTIIHVDNYTHNIDPFFDTSWNKLGLSHRENILEYEVKKPKNLNEMLTVASKLSKDFDFVRVDLFNINDRAFFGELTFTPSAGFLKLKPESWDYILGQKWQIRL
jgi:hypothetical protein